MNTIQVDVSVLRLLKEKGSEEREPSKYFIKGQRERKAIRYRDLLVRERGDKDDLE